MSIPYSSPPQNDPDLAAAHLGIEVRHFIEHDFVGRYLVDRANAARAQALEALAEIDPGDKAAIEKAQAAARIPALFLCWLSEAMQQASAAEHRIQLDAAAGVENLTPHYRDEALYE